MTGASTERERLLDEENVLLKRELASMREALHHLTVALVRQDDAIAARNERFEAVERAVQVDGVFARRGEARVGPAPQLTRAPVDRTRRIRPARQPPALERDDSDIETGPVPVYTADLVHEEA